MLRTCDIYNSSNCNAIYSSCVAEIWMSKIFFFKWESLCPSPHNLLWAHLLLTGSKERKFWAVNFFFIFKKLSLPNTLFFRVKTQTSVSRSGDFFIIFWSRWQKNNLFKGETNLFFFLPNYSRCNKKAKNRVTLTSNIFLSHSVNYSVFLFS